MKCLHPWICIVHLAVNRIETVKENFKHRFEFSAELFLICNSMLHAPSWPYAHIVLCLLLVYKTSHLLFD